MSLIAIGAFLFGIVTFVLVIALPVFCIIIAVSTVVQFGFCDRSDSGMHSIDYDKRTGTLKCNICENSFIEV